MGAMVEWEVRARVWVAYWPNKRTPLHPETRMLEFQEAAAAHRCRVGETFQALCPKNHEGTIGI